jgi:hypothetical protein
VGLCAYSDPPSGLLVEIARKLRSRENSGTIGTDKRRMLSPILRDVIALRRIDMEASVPPAGKAECDWNSP